MLAFRCRDRLGKLGLANYESLVAAPLDRASGVRLVAVIRSLTALRTSIGSPPPPIAQLFGELACYRIPVAVGVPGLFFFVGCLARSILRIHLIPSVI